MRCYYCDREIISENLCYEEKMPYHFYCLPFNDLGDEGKTALLLSDSLDDILEEIEELFLAHSENMEKNIYNMVSGAYELLFAAQKCLTGEE